MVDTYGTTGETTPTPPSGEKQTPDPKTEQPSDQKGTDSEGKSGEPAGKKDAEARINQLLAKTKELEDKLNEVSTTQTPAPVPGKKPPLTAEAQRAADQIESLGFQDEEAVNKKIQQLEDRILLDSEHVRMEASIDGSDGRPKYDRKEVESYMRQRAVYNPQVAYEDKYKQELLDWNIKQAQDKPATPASQAPSGQGEAQQGGDVITREVIREKMTTPEWREYYDANRDKILTLMQKGQL